MGSQVLYLFLVGLFCFMLLLALLLFVSSMNDNSDTTNLLRHQDYPQQQKQQHVLSSSSSSSSSKSKSLLFDSPDDIPMDIIDQLDAILVLGGGKPKSINHPPLFVEKRCDDALEVILKRRRNRKRDTINSNNHNHNDELPILCLSAGTAHLPQLLSEDGLPIWESTACASYILSKSNSTTTTTTTITNGGEERNTVLSKDYPIYVETTSYDTIGNAYYARLVHTDIMNWNTLLIITNEFHMDRTRKIFNWIYSMNNDNNNISNRSSNYQLYYLQSPNFGLSNVAIHARKEREQQSSIHVDQLSQTKTTLKEVSRFLTQEHSLYTATKLINRGRHHQEHDDGVVTESVKISYGM